MYRKRLLQSHAVHVARCIQAAHLDHAEIINASRGIKFGTEQCFSPRCVLDMKIQQKPLKDNSRGIFKDASEIQHRISPVF